MSKKYIIIMIIYEKNGMRSSEWREKGLERMNRSMRESRDSVRKRMESVEKLRNEKRG